MSLIRFLQKEIPSMVLDETELLILASKLHPEINYRDITGDFLNRVQEERGVDLTTAFLYDQIINRSGNESFYKKFNSYSPESGKMGRIQGKVLTVPAGFYRELPEYAGDGSLVISAANKFGLEASVIPVLSHGRMEENAQIIRDEIQKSKYPLYIFSFSKGGSDFRVFLESYPELIHKIKLWVSICGIHKSTPLVNRFVRKSKLGNLFAKSVLTVAGISPEFVTDFSSDSSPLSKPFQIPRKLKTLSVIGVPLESHLKGTIRSRYKYLSQFGPNDGMVLLLDAILPNSKIIPVWGADHYFRSPRISNLIYQIFNAIHKGWL